MKTFVIKLENHDDAISTRDKMAWSKAPRILLVWPEESRILSSRMDLVQVSRFALQLGAQLALVTDSIAVEDQARELNIPVFTSVPKAQQLTWRRGRQRRRLPDRDEKALERIQELKDRVDKAGHLQEESIWVRVTAFVAGLLAVLALVGLFLPSAIIILKLPETDQSLSLQVWASPNLNAPTISGGVPAYLMAVTVEGQDEVSSSGTLTIPAQRASGVVRVTNLTGNPVSIREGTIVSTISEMPVRFELVKSVEVPGGPGKAVDVEVIAVMPGRAGNVGTDEVKAIEGQQGLSLSVRNIQEMQGGEDVAVPMPTESDYQKLALRLRQTLNQKALEQLKLMVKPNQHLILASLQQGNILNEIRDPQEGNPADRLRLSMEGKFTAWYYTEEDLQFVAENTLDATLSSDQVAVPDTLFLTTLSEPEISGESVRWDIHAIRKIEPSMSSQVISGLVTGKKPEDAARFLEEKFRLQNPVEVSLSPEWWLYLPFLSFRIQVVAQ